MANEADPMKDMFDRARSQHGEKLQFTESEAEKFKKAFDDPEFRKLFAEYMDEMQDPKNREENEAYIRQLEEEEKVPEGKELIRPTACFVVKTHKTVGEGGKGDKVFINIVQSDKISEPIKTTTKEGTSWSLPYCLGPPHMERDKGGQNVACFDCCFHPDAVSQIALHKQFRDSLVLTALEGVEEAYRRQKQTVTLSKEYHVLKGVNYKEGQIPTLLVDATNKKKEWNPSTSFSSSATAVASAVTQSPVPAAPIPPSTTTTVNAGEGSTKSDSSSGSTNSKPSSAKEPAIKKGFLNAASAKEAAARPKGNSLIQEIPDGVRPSKSSVSTSASSSSGSGTSSGKGESTQSQTEANVLAAIGMKERVSKPISSTGNSAPPTEGSSPAASSSSSNPSAVSGSRTTVPAPAASTASVDVDSSKKPKYTITERGQITMGDFENVRSRAASRRPAELVIRLEIPLVAKASQVDLDVAERLLKFKYADVYDLQISLPYPVFDKKGGAKYDKASKTLTVTLPVQPAPLAEIFTTAAQVTSSITEEQQNETDKGEGKQDGNSASSPKKSASAPSPDKEKGKSASTSAPVSHSRWVGGSEAERLRQESEKLAEELREKAEAAKKAALEAAAAAAASVPSSVATPITTTTPSSVAPSQSASPLQSGQAGAGVVSSDTITTTVDDVIAGDFHPCDTFQGPRKGYVFKLGGKGLGYYVDEPPHLKKAAPVAASAAPQSTPGAAPAPAPSATEPKSVSATANFPYDYRETKFAVSVLVQVADIVASSVDIAFGDNGVDVRFTAAPTTKGSKTPQKTEAAAVDYAMGFDVAGKIRASECKYDVASKNMVIVLVKESESYWAAEETKGSSENDTDIDAITDAPILKARAYRRNRGAPEVGGKSKPKSAMASSEMTVDALKNQLSNMQFSTGTAILDLD